MLCCNDADTRQFHSDAMLTMTVVHCVGTLDAVGVHLPSLVLIAEQFFPPLTSDAAASETDMHD